MGPPLASSVRSAGVLLLLSCAAPDTAQAPAWTLSVQPAVSIGSVEGDDRYLLTGVSSVLLLRDGRIAIAERTGGAIRVYGSNGRHIADWGRKGTGPGEYSYIRTIAHYRGDSIAVHDMVQRKISILDSQGKFGRSFILRMDISRQPGTIPSQSCCGVVGAFADGSFIAWSPDAIPNGPGGPRWSLRTYYRVSPDGARVDSIGSWQSSRFSFDASAPNQIRGFHFSSRTVEAITGDRIYLGNGNTPTIDVVSVAANAVRPAAPIQTNRPLRPVTREMQRQFLDRIRKSYADNPSRYEGPVESYLAGEFPEHLPVYSQLFTDPAGNVWVFQWAYDRNPATPLHFDVFNSAGRAIATMSVPGGRGVLAVGTNSIAFIEQDEDDVEHVRVYRIQRN